MLGLRCRLALRNSKGTIAQLITPICVTLLLLSFQQLANTVLSQEDRDPTVATVEFPPSCSSADCVTLLYAPVGVPWVERLMDRYAELAQVNSSLQTTFQFNISIRVVFCRCLATP